MMRMIHMIAQVMLFAVLAVQVFAHSDIKMTVPTNGAIVATAPAAITINMNKKIRLINVTMQHNDNGVFTIDIATHKQFKTHFTLPIEPMGAGIYNFFWRALGEDGHPVKGALQFTVME